MNERGSAKNVELYPARTGRPRSRSRAFANNEPVVLAARVPAQLAARVYETADQRSKPVSTVVSEILASAYANGEAPTT